MGITLKSSPLPAAPNARPEQREPTVTEPLSFTTSRPLGLQDKAKEVTIGNITGTIVHLPGTEKRPAVVYADSRMMTAIAISCLRAEGVDDGRAAEIAVRALEAVYHGGNPELERLGIKAPAMILPAEKRDGAKIAHALAHARGGSENEARDAEIKYLSRRGVTGPGELPALDARDYPTPDIRPGEQGKVISFSLGIGGVGGPRYPSYGSPRVTPSSPQSPQRGPSGESEFARMLRESSEARRVESALPVVDKVDNLFTSESREAARAEQLRQEIEELLRRMFPPPVTPQLPPKILPPEAAEGSGGISLGEASMGGGATGGQGQQGRRDQPRDDKGNKETKE
ncbi:MAG: hypothetical protein EBZ48_15455 [Proteobacteria bacterium]|nr:hypothetical protein [Pseudomonadota bacterium]